MPIILRVDQPEEYSICLETRKGTKINNGFSLLLTPFEQGQLQRIRNNPRYKGIDIRITYSPHFNCHGLSFGSRRTCISDSAIIPIILREDDYEEVSAAEVKCGDIIFYLGEDGDYEHSGIVVSPPDNGFQVPLVLSKWGLGFEVIHWAHVSPYTFNVKYFRVIK